jgi:DNA-binding PadR family transcriptional regulator
MTSELREQPVREHSGAWPHDDSHHVVAAFALLLFERGVETTEQLSARLTQLQVVRGRIEPESLARLIEDLETTGLIARREGTTVAYELTPAGRTVVDDWAAIMRDRRHRARTFLALYDRSDE